MDGAADEGLVKKTTKAGRGWKIVLSVFLLVCLGIALTVGLVLHFKNLPEETHHRRAALVDCHPDPGVTKERCLDRGCEWKKAEDENTPSCLYTSSNSGYDVIKTDVAANGDQQIRLQRRGTVRSVFGMDVHEYVTLSIHQYSNDAVRIKLSPEGVTPYEIPKEALDLGTGSTANADVKYRVVVYDTPFSIQVVRNSTGTVIFDSTSQGLILADQFLQLTTRLPSDTVYGFGEHNHRRFKHDMNWKTWSIFTRDVGPIDAWNLYGAQPLHMTLETDGNANIVFLKNSNAMEVTLQPAPYPAITYRTIGGVLDFYVFVGPAPTQAIAQYTKAVGLPAMPPYWVLGFQLCRWHYGNLSHVEAVVERNKVAGIPQDVQWGDIDYMFEKLLFTVDKTTYGGLPEFVDKLHSQGQKYIVIVDPGVGNEPDKLARAALNSPNYNMYEEGVNRSVYVMDKDGGVLQGKVWPGQVGFPDFTNVTNTLPWWVKWINYFRNTERIDVDGLWIDMNEVANFVKGSTTGCERNQWNNPPYAPNILGRDENNTLYDKTICMDSTQSWGRHYDVHSLYGHSMAITTYKALKEISPTKRPVVVTRSNFPGTAHYASHWLGDNQSRWPNLHWSIIGLLEYSIFGFPLVGADICGFWYEAEYEMCLRWQQLGAFYPFSRNHNAHNDPGKPEFKDQDPAAWGGDFVRIVKDPLMIRYKLLPYLYTLLHRAHVYGETVVRPFMFTFPTDEVAIAVDRQFMWGSGLLISPVLDQGKTSVEAYFPRSDWYDYYTGESPASTGAWQTLDAPLEKINLHVHGGNILPWQFPANTTVYSRNNNFGLIVALDSKQTASGELFWDDGETLDTFKNGMYLSLKFKIEQANKLMITVEHSGYPGAASLRLTTIEFYGLPRDPDVVMVDGTKIPAANVQHVKDIVKLVDLNMSMTSNHEVTWSLF